VIDALRGGLLDDPDGALEGLLGTLPVLALHRSQHFLDLGLRPRFHGRVAGLALLALPVPFFRRTMGSQTRILLAGTISKALSYISFEDLSS